MKKNLKKNPSGFDDNNFFSGKKVSATKNKGLKKRLSIYEEFEEEDEDFVVREKFKKRNK
ncbi:MAG: hypothetical protein EOM73_04615 [Bacteroidia bacterium]|nr:hypothetical protein [Bacteroidia bacterium]